MILQTLAGQSSLIDVIFSVSLVSKVSYHDRITLIPDLLQVEASISRVQEKLALGLTLKARRHWLENGERSLGFLKRSAADRSARTTIPALIHPVTGSMCSSIPAMSTAASSFYSTLYQDDPVDPLSIQILLAAMPASTKVSTSESEFLLHPFAVDEIVSAASRTPPRSSLGLDGLPYTVLRLLLSYPHLSQLVVTLFNQALFEDSSQHLGHPPPSLSYPRKGTSPS
ncbi:hypothetical protein DM01DRAFT_312014 [Hesseltinella vesiculosa]|uniref:Uncharacterized protein n=1 Tax=Hesseltinella vesiculosa TaxID=101127 RepID=A0A1X2GLW2_9FUNG|nr:hypothetical protein DM01DRAFT_312014 [Hesseltinella vesiculosa]